MRKFFEEEMYLDELKDRVKNLKKKSCGNKMMRLAACVVSMVIIGCLIGLLVACILKKRNNNCCCGDEDDCCRDDEDDCCCDKDNDNEEKCTNGTFAHDDDFEDA